MSKTLENVRSGLTRREFVKTTGQALSVCAVGGGLSVTPPAKAASLPVWSRVPNQTFAVGQPVMIDLADYVTDADGDALEFSIDLPLPPGLTLTGSVISGTPTAPSQTQQYTVSADDGTLQPKAPAGVSLD
ncbi:MAG: twin-arginine translocation signal domain-containing protein [Pseudomonadota bacterium]